MATLYPPRRKQTKTSEMMATLASLEKEREGAWRRTEKKDEKGRIRKKMITLAVLDKREDGPTLPFDKHCEDVHPLTPSKKAEYGHPRIPSEKAKDGHPRSL